MELDRCRDLEDQLPRYALGLADKVFAMRIQLHLAEGCVVCAGRVEEVLVAFHHSALPSQAQPVPADFVDRVLRRVDGLDQEPCEASSVYPAPPERALLWTLLLLGLLMVCAVAWWGQGQGQLRAEAQARVDRLELAMQRSAEDIRALQSLAGRLGDPRLRVVDGQSSGDQLQGVLGRALLDPDRQELWLRVVGLAPAAEELDYVLWHVTEDQALFLGVLAPVVLAQQTSSYFALAEDRQEIGQLSIHRQESFQRGQRPQGEPVLELKLTEQ